MHPRSVATDRVELVCQRMRRIDFIVSIRADQQQMLHVRLDQQIFQQIKRRRVQPLQIVEKEGQWMLGSRKYANESTEYQSEAALRVLWRKFRYRWLFSYNELQLRDQIYNELSVRI